jgi:hypothetical protein
VTVATLRWAAALRGASAADAGGGAREERQAGDDDDVPVPVPLSGLEAIGSADGAGTAGKAPARRRRRWW